jgi:hypothetical protein
LTEGRTHEFIHFEFRIISPFGNYGQKESTFHRELSFLQTLTSVLTTSSYGNVLSPWFVACVFNHHLFIAFCFVQTSMPLYIGKLWTYPERVTKDNIDELRKWKLNGNDEYPRARFVEHPNDDKKFLKYARSDQIASGLKIFTPIFSVNLMRHLRSDDIVVFNRQPSLHRNSIMTHRVRILPDRTFRLNECVCTS